MIQKERLTDPLPYTTVRICCETEQGSSVGTGFFFKFKNDDGNETTTIITNKHVIKGSKNGYFHICIADENGQPKAGKYHTVKYDNFESRWIPHPGNYDLCAMPIATDEIEIRENVKLYYQQFGLFSIPQPITEERFQAVEDIYTVGYPERIWDNVNNLPIIRKGITSTHLCNDYRGRKEFLIDAAVFLGTSGSPVVRLKEPKQLEPDLRSPLIHMREQVLLLGVIYKLYGRKADGVVVTQEIPTLTTMSAETILPLNLGIVIKAELLHDFKPLLVK